MTTNLASSPDIIGSLGGILAGVAEILGLIGAGIGFLVRSRRNARRERIRTETAASLAAQEAKKQLEARLEKQHQDQIELYRQQLADNRQSYESQLEDLQNAFDLQIQNYKQQIASLTKDRDDLFRRVLNIGGKDDRT